MKLIILSKSESFLCPAVAFQGCVDNPVLYWSVDSILLNRNPTTLVCWRQLQCKVAIVNCTCSTIVTHVDRSLDYYKCMCSGLAIWVGNTGVKSTSSGPEFNPQGKRWKHLSSHSSLFSLALHLCKTMHVKRII